MKKTTEKHITDSVSKMREYMMVMEDEPNREWSQANIGTALSNIWQGVKNTGSAAVDAASGIASGFQAAQAKEAGNIPAAQNTQSQQTSTTGTAGKPSAPTAWPTTRQAIVDFQTANGLKADGLIGKNTYAFLTQKYKLTPPPNFQMVKDKNGATNPTVAVDQNSQTNTAPATTTSYAVPNTNGTPTVTQPFADANVTANTTKIGQAQQAQARGPAGTTVGTDNAVANAFNKIVPAKQTTLETYMKSKNEIKLKNAVSNLKKYMSEAEGRNAEYDRNQKSDSWYQPGINFLGTGNYKTKPVGYNSNALDQDGQPVLTQYWDKDPITPSDYDYTHQPHAQDNIPDPKINQNNQQSNIQSTDSSTNAHPADNSTTTNNYTSPDYNMNGLHFGTEIGHNDGTNQNNQLVWPTTPADIIKFQKANGLKQDAMIGNKTYDALKKAGYKPPDNFHKIGNKVNHVQNKPNPNAPQTTAPVSAPANDIVKQNNDEWKAVQAKNTENTIKVAKAQQAELAKSGLPPEKQTAILKKSFGNEIADAVINASATPVSSLVPTKTASQAVTPTSASGQPMGTTTQTNESRNFTNTADEIKYYSQILEEAAPWAAWAAKAKAAQDARANQMHPQSDIKPVDTPVPPVPPTVHNTKQQSNPKVKEMQQILIKFGYLPNGADTGVIDKKTRIAQKEFQTAYKSTPTPINPMSVNQTTPMMEHVSFGEIDSLARIIQLAR